MVELLFLSAADALRGIYCSTEAFVNKRGRGPGMSARRPVS
jgi:hypothetical protein